MIKLAYNANGLRGLSLPEAIAVTAAAGFDGIELSLHPDHLDPATATDADCAALGRRMADSGLAAASLATGADTLLSGDRFEPSLIHPDPAARARRVDLIRRAIDMAAILGAPVVGFASGPCRADISVDQAAGHLREGVRRCLDHAAGRVHLAIEPEPGFFVATNRQALRLLHEIGAVGEAHLAINQDIGHEHVATDDYTAAIAEALPHTAHIHVEDIRGRVHQHLIPGDGDIDFPGVIRLLRAGGYDGFLSVELYNHAEDYRRAMAESRDFLRPLLAQATEGVPA
jgi:sugar phosphate isomerase/epimerase